MLIGLAQNPLQFLSSLAFCLCSSICFYEPSVPVKLVGSLLSGKSSDLVHQQQRSLTWDASASWQPSFRAHFTFCRYIKPSLIIQPETISPMNSAFFKCGIRATRSGINWVLVKNADPEPLPDFLTLWDCVPEIRVFKATLRTVTFGSNYQSHAYLYHHYIRKPWLTVTEYILGSVFSPSLLITCVSYLSVCVKHKDCFRHFSVSIELSIILSWMYQQVSCRDVLIIGKT